MQPSDDMRRLNLRPVTEENTTQLTWRPLREVGERGDAPPWSRAEPTTSYETALDTLRGSFGGPPRLCRMFWHAPSPSTEVEKLTWIVEDGRARLVVCNRTWLRDWIGMRNRYPTRYGSPEELFDFEESSILERCRRASWYVLTAASLMEHTYVREFIAECYALVDARKRELPGGRAKAIAALDAVRFNWTPERIAAFGECLEAPRMIGGGSWVLTRFTPDTILSYARSVPPPDENLPPPELRRRALDDIRGALR